MLRSKVSCQEMDFTECTNQVKKLAFTVEASLVWLFCSYNFATKSNFSNKIVYFCE